MGNFVTFLCTSSEESLAMLRIKYSKTCRLEAIFYEFFSALVPYDMFVYIYILCNVLLRRLHADVLSGFIPRQEHIFDVNISVQHGPEIHYA